MEINILEEIKKETTLRAENLSEMLAEIARLTETHLNALPKTGLMGDADISAKKKSVASHYNFVRALGEKLTETGDQRSSMVSLSEELDKLYSQAEFEELEGISTTGENVFELLKKIEETENVSGRFIDALDRLADSANKGENADFRSAARICREYFEFVTNTSSYIDNLKIF